MRHPVPVPALLTRLLVVAASVTAAAPARAALEVALETTTTPMQPVGTTTFWVASASGAWELTYRFRVGAAGAPSRIVRDFSPRNYMDWTPLDEGVFDITVTVRSSETGERAEAVSRYTVTSPVAGPDPVVAPTSHPLVALYSAPPECVSGLVWVRFRPEGAQRWQSTTPKPCRPGRSLSFLVAGLLGERTYELQHVSLEEGVLHEGPLLTHRTGAPASSARGVVLTPPGPRTSLAERVVLHAALTGSTLPSFPYATDLAGRLIWYYDRSQVPWQTGSHLVRPLPGGTMLLIMNEVGRQWQLLREIDLVGNTLRETTAGRVSEQLETLGHDRITAFHHDALRLANGHTLVLASVERILTGVQSPGPVDVLGDMVVDLDPDLQVAWAWNAFEHLDPGRRAILGEHCVGPVDGCRPLALAPWANDWTHTNSIDYSPSDGALLLSVRNQDWVIKVDYRDGAGEGDVLWRLGREGDFEMRSSEPWPWFSHQHDARHEGSRIVLYDNGTTRCVASRLRCQSRGQVLALDEEARTAELVVNVPLGHFSSLMGTAQPLANGNYSFASGWVYPGPHSEVVETEAAGTVVYRLGGFYAYRSYRMRSLYRP